MQRLAAEGRPVVLYDQVGCGRSDARPGVRWTLEVFLDELDLLRAELGLSSVHLLGTSWGGMLALEHALRRPGSLESLTLSSTLASASEWAGEARRLRDELPEPVRQVLERHGLDRTGLDRQGETDVPDEPEYERALAQFDARHFFRGDPQRPELALMRAQRAPEVYRATWGPNEWTITGTLRGWDIRHRLHELQLPTLVLRGRYDLCTDTIARTLLEGISGAREVVFEESSHTPVLEETERYLAVVREFIDASAASSASIDRPYPGTGKPRST